MAPAPNRRRHVRIAVRGTAVLHLRGGVIRADVENLSAGGLLVRPIAGCVNGLRPHQRVQLELHLAGGITLAHAGRIARCPVGAIAIELDVPSAELEDAIAEEMLASVEASRAPRVIVVDRADQRRHRVAEALTHAGYKPIETSTPLEAIDVLEATREHVAAAMVSGDSLTQTAGDELASFLAESHPDLRVAVISDHPRAPTQPEIPVIAVDEREELTGKLRQIVG
jgi:hypothetical protein